MTSVSAGHILLTPTQPVGGGRPQRESNPEPPHQESRALPTELPPPPPPPPRKIARYQGQRWPNCCDSGKLRTVKNRRCDYFRI